MVEFRSRTGTLIKKSAEPNFENVSKWVSFLAITVIMVAVNVTLNRIALVLLSVICVLNIIHSGAIIRVNKLLISMFLYGLWLFFSQMWSVASTEQVNASLSSYLSMLLVVFIMTNNIHDEKDVSFYLNAYVVAAIIQLFYLLFVYGLNIFDVVKTSGYHIRIGDLTSNSNAVGLLFAYGTVISTFFYQKTQKQERSRKWFYFGVALIAAVFTLLTASRKAMAFLFGGIFVVILLCGERRDITSRLRAVFLSVISVALLYYFVNHLPLFNTINQRMRSLLDGFKGVGEFDSSSANRFMYIKDGLNLFAESPFLGKGVNASIFYFHTYTHNNFVEILLNTGIIGFLIYYTPYIIYLFEFIRAKKDSILWLLFVIYLWILISGFGMVTYFEKSPMILIIISISWLDIKIAMDEENSMVNTKQSKYIKA